MGMRQGIVVVEVATTIFLAGRLGAELPVRGISTDCKRGLPETSRSSKKENVKPYIKGVKLQ